ncbi:MAG TPA: AAA family ATPase [Kofleriaceae bacterium]|nr:AAA family ATPase [Kofleriaceae bacterium]
MSAASFRVYFATHDDGRVGGTLMRRFDRFLDQPPPAAYGVDDEAVYAQLEHAIVELEADDPSDVDRYLWTETFSVRRVDANVHPLNVVGQRRVIGARNVPLRLMTAWCELDGGGFRVMIPRFQWWFVVEDLEVLSAVVEQAISSTLLGSPASTLFNFRFQGVERVEAWQPAFLSRRTPPNARAQAAETPPVLAAVAEELVDKAGRKRLAPVLGIDPVFEAHARLFERDPLPSIVVVGPAGVGKSTFVRRLAFHLLARRRGKLGEGRRNVQLWSTSADRLVAGMVYLGMWQDRILRLVEELSHEGDYLYVDRLPGILTPQSDGATIADLLAPAIEAGEISVIAECDERELTRSRQRFPGLIDQFRVIRLAEPPAATLAPVMERYLRRVSAPFTVHPSSYRRALGHLGAFRRDLAFPGKAFQFFEWLARDTHLGVTAGTVFPSEMSEAFSRYSGLPVELISDDLPMAAAAIADRLASRVIGQDEACGTCGRVLGRFKAGLDDPDRPVANLLFAGPTGVGKTELAKQLAAYLFGASDRLIRLDMSEYMLPGSSGRLLDVGAGVTSLAEQVRRQPLCVVLLDEIEKAHPEIFDLLLGILGEGRLTDSGGRLVDFRMAVIVMTSNLGARTTAPAGFGDRASDDYLRAITRHFRPEFFHRIDHVIPFRPLGRAQVEAIVDLEIARVRQRVGLTQRKIRLRLTDGGRARLALLGYEPTMGARPLKRVIEERVVTPLAVKLAADPSFGDIEVAIVDRDPGPHDIVV